MTTLLNKKILLSLGVIAFAAALGVGATIAAFTASDTITGNTIATATVRIDAAEVATGGATPKPVNASNLIPGEVDPHKYEAQITNNSSVPLNLYMYMTSSTGPACDKTKLAWQSTNSTGTTVLHGYTTEPTLITDSNFDFLSAMNTLTEKVLIASSTAPGATIIVRQKVGLDTTATNSDQGGCTWTDTFYGETVAL